MSESSNFPTVMPSLLLDFANAKQLDPRITFTRASTATYYDEDTVAKAEENLLLQSQTFDKASWTISSSGTSLTITANAVNAPDGTTTAEQLTNTATNLQHRIFQSVSAVRVSTQYAISFFAKNNTAGFIAVSLYDDTSFTRNAAASFNLSTGAAGATAASGTGYSVDSTSITETPAGSGWYRCTAVVTVGSTCTTPSIAFAVQTASTLGGNYGLGSAYLGANESIYIWGAQLEQRSAVTAYTPTTTQPITNYIPVLMTAAAGVPRFIFNPTTRESLGLLIEEQRVNLLTYSEQFNNAAWSKSGSTIGTNTLVSPDGTVSADKLIEDTTTGEHKVTQVASLVSGTTYTFSFYAKMGERTGVSFYGAGGLASVVGTVNLSTGQVISGTVTVVSVGNGWYRISASGASAFTGNNSITIRVYNTSASYTGDGYSGIYIWGAQLEAGAFATSYIPTVASSVTRSTDAASMTGVNFSQWYRADEGTLYLEGIANTTGYSASMNDNSNSNAITLVSGTSGTAFWVDVSGVSQAAIGTRSLSMRYAGAYKANDIAFSSAGGVVATDTTATIPVVSQLNIGTRSGGSGPISGTIKKIAYYPWRLTNAQLQALTS